MPCLREGRQRLFSHDPETQNPVANHRLDAAPGASLSSVPAGLHRPGRGVCLRFLVSGSAAGRPAGRVFPPLLAPAAPVPPLLQPRGKGAAKDRHSQGGGGGIRRHGPQAGRGLHEPRPPAQLPKVEVPRQLHCSGHQRAGDFSGGLVLLHHRSGRLLPQHLRLSHPGPLHLCPDLVFGRDRRRLPGVLGGQVPDPPGEAPGDTETKEQAFLEDSG